jgi:predicted AAA+ superfamily ATPase
VKRYLDMFDGSYLIRLLPAYHVNVGKRLRTAPKVYYRDSGILHALWGVKDKAGLLGHPGLGFSWEGWAMEQVIRVMNHLPEQCFYWGTHGGAELDLLVDTGSRRIGYEFKFADAPKTTKSMRVALADLKLDRLYVVHPGSQRFPLADDAPIEALGVQSLAPPL